MADYTVYPKSQHEGVFMARDAQGIDFLMDGAVRRELNHETACFLRERFPWTAPVPVLRRERTVGVGDRLPRPSARVRKIRRDARAGAAVHPRIEPDRPHV